MKKTLISLFVVAAVGITTVGLFASDHEEEHEDYEREHSGKRDHDDDHEHREHRGASASAYLSAPQYKLYKTECGDCHMAYPPAMLPAASWQGMMGSLEDHFGDNAELDAATADQIAEYLTDNAARESGGEYGERSWRATKDRNPPLRITQTDYFRGQHHEIPAKMVTDNTDVVSFSRCETCHGDAEQGNFDEHGVRIPGYGRWDD